MFINLSSEGSARMMAAVGSAGSGADSCPSHLLADEVHPDQSRFDRASLKGSVAR